MYDFCAEHKVNTQRVGKIIVATHVEELERLQSLYERGIENGVKVSMLNSNEEIRFESMLELLIGSLILSLI